MTIGVLGFELEEALRNVRPLLPRSKFFRKIHLEVVGEDLIVATQNADFYYHEIVPTFFIEGDGRKQADIEFKDIYEVVKAKKDYRLELDFDDGLMINLLYIKTYEGFQWKPVDLKETYYIGYVPYNALEDDIIEIKRTKIKIPEKARPILKPFTGLVHFSKTKNGLIIKNRARLLLVKYFQTY